MTAQPTDTFDPPKVEGPEQCRVCRGYGRQGIGSIMQTCSRCGGTGRHVDPRDIIRLLTAISSGKRPFRVDESKHGPPTIWDAQDTGWIARVKESLPFKNEIGHLVVLLLNGASWLASSTQTLEYLGRLYAEREELRVAGKLEEAVTKQQEIDRILRGVSHG